MSQPIESDDLAGRERHDPDLAFRGELRDRGARGVVVAVALVLVTFIGINLLPGNEPRPDTVTADESLPLGTIAPRPTPWHSTYPLRIAAITPRPAYALDPGAYYLAWPEMRLRLTLPDGWLATGGGTAFSKASDFSSDLTFSVSANSPTWVGDGGPDRVPTDICPIGERATFVSVGPTVEALRTALESLVGVDRSGPTAERVGGFASTRYDLSNLSCLAGPEGRWLWSNAEGSDGFGILKGGSASIHVVDVNGDRLVIASEQRGASASDLAELDAIVASIDIESSAGAIHPVGGDLSIGRHALAVAGIPLSIDVSDARWEPHSGMSLNKSVVGPQSAEGIVYWTTPNGPIADPCAEVLGSGIGESVADLAAAVAAAAGTDLLSGPTNVTVGGRTAQLVRLFVREDLGCRPGFLFGWPERQGGAFWGNTRPGKVRVWIVEVGAKRVVIVGLTSADVSPALEVGLAEEIEQMVDSVGFE